MPTNPRATATAAAYGPHVTIWYDRADTQAWHWERFSTGGPRSPESGFPSREAALQDARRVLGVKAA